jgi:integrase
MPIMSTQPNGNGRRKGTRRPVEYVKHPDTDVIVDGLRYHKGSGMYYRIEAKGSDEKRAKNHYYPTRGLKGVAYLRRAIFEHQCHQQGQAVPTMDFIPVDVPIPLYDTATESRVIGQAVSYVTLYDERTGEAKSALPVSKGDLARYFREQLLNPDTRADFATAMGMPELVHIEKLRPSGLSLPLDLIGTRYLNKTPPMDAKTKRDSKAYWDEFKELVGVRTVAELTAKHFRTYRDTVNHNRAKGRVDESGKAHPLSPSYIRARFGAIKAVFRFAQTEGEDVESLANAVTLCRMLKAPKQNGVSAHPIPLAEFHKMLEKADSKWKAILLLSLNCAFYPVDVMTVEKTHIDLQAGTLCNRRTKTGVPRIAVLWGQTVKAIRDYQAEHPHDEPTVFVSAYGTRYSADHIRRGFRKLRDDSGVDESIGFEQIRDAAQTYAIRAGASPLEVDMLLGHRTNIRDNYLERCADMVADACRKLEAYCFPPKAEQPKADGKAEQTKGKGKGKGRKGTVK